MKAILLLAIITLSSQTQYNLGTQFNFSKKRSLVDVMIEVENRMKAGSPIDAIETPIIRFKEYVNQEQVYHEAIYAEQKAICDAENAFREKEITEQSNILRDSTNQLESCSAQKVRAQNELDVNEEQTFTNQEHLRIVTEMRDKEESHYKNRSIQQQDSLRTIEEAQDILGGIYQGQGSFAQLSKVSHKMLLQAVNTNKAAIYAPVLSAFAQLSTNEQQLDESALEQVDQLLVTLRKNLETAYADFTESNGEAIQAFNDQKERLETNLQRLKEQAERLEDEVEDLNQCIGTQSAIQQTAQNRLSRNQDLYDQNTDLCNNFQNQFEVASALRRHEIKLATEFWEFIQRRFTEAADEQQQRVSNIGRAQD